jgi:iron complex transport system ATP-binding protein
MSGRAPSGGVRAVLELRGVVAGYGAREVLHGLTFGLSAGEVVGLVGPNGAGKSTLVAVAARGLAPTAGEVLLDGAPLRGYGRRALARRLAVVPQGGELPEGFTVDEVVAMGRTPHAGFLRGPAPADEAAIEDALRRTDVFALRARRVETLSGGERQRVVLARALAQDPGVLLLDEPTNHLDLRYQVETLRVARAAAAHGVAVLVVVHDLNLAARACDRVALLEAGRIVANGPPAEVFTQARLRSVYQADVRVHELDGVPTVVPGPLP